LTINGPVQGAANLPPGPVLVTFDIQNSPVPLSTTHPRMHFFVDNDPVAYKFYDGPAIGENGSTSGVRYQSVHTHFVHWKSGGSIQLNALASGPHQVQFALVDQADVPIPFTPPAVTNLVTAFRMNEGSGTTLADASGNGHTGTLVNGPTWVASQATYGKALSFDGLDDAVSVANSGTYKFGTTDFTLETWVKRNVLGGAQRHLFSTCTATTSPGWEAGCKELYFNAGNQLIFGSFSTGDLPSGIVIADTAWHHIALTFNKNTTELQFYVDGVPANTVTQDLEPDGAGHVVTVGNLFGNNTFSGLLDEFRIFSRVLTQAEIQAEVSSTAKTLTFTIPPGTGGEFSLQEVASGLGFPTAMATAPDGRIFVNEIDGNIRVVTPTATPPWLVQGAPFATLDVVTGEIEKGLLGIAVDPNFNMNNYVYVYYSPTNSGPINRVVRFTATTSGGNTMATSPTVIVDNLPASDATHGHNGGIIHFGPDGKLYIFVGENEVAADAQSLSSLRGKILRIDPNGGIPSDNPIFNPPLQAPFSMIYSYGHRNSFGFTFHPLTQDLWETENGENDNDQINRIIAGKNYGWPLCTGICGDPRWIDPIITINPVIAPTGIVAIRTDSVYPAQYHNNLLFADFNVGQLHRIVLSGPGLTDLADPSDSTIVCNCGQGGLVAVMHGLNVPGQDGYIYVSNVGGSIFRVVLN
jgi:glucose/arabinose dehydrogenase